MKKRLLLFIVFFFGLAILFSNHPRLIVAAEGGDCHCTKTNNICVAPSPNPCNTGYVPICGIDMYKQCSICNCINISCGNENQQCCPTGKPCNTDGYNCQKGICKWSPTPTPKSYRFSGDVARISDLGDMINKLISYVLGLAGIVFFILLLMGGFRFITSGGDPKAVEGARKTITSAIIGLIVILTSYIILVIIRNITGVDVTKFNLMISP